MTQTMSAERIFRQDLADRFKARFPILYVETSEEDRVLAEIAAIATDAGLIKTPRTVFEWSLTSGVAERGQPAKEGTADPLAALGFIEEVEAPAIFVFKDLHVCLGGGSLGPEAPVVRRLRDLLPLLKGSEAPQNIVITAPTLHLPPELEKDVTVVDFALPDASQICQRLEDLVQANEQVGRVAVELAEPDKTRLVEAALGLTLQEAENAFARAMVNDGRLDADDVEMVFEEKRQLVQKSGVLEFIKSTTTFDHIGGLENLKRWLSKRAGAWNQDARRYSIPSPKGVLITGVPGCGKSLTAKCVSAQWGLPLLRLDIGRIFHGLIGSSEQNMRAALRSAEAVAPTVLWIDEIEKGFAGTGGEANDTGVGARVFGTFLTWMQEKEKPVFVIATSNSIDRLPPEFLRKGRFDEIFFVDLPSDLERQQILKLHLEKRLREPEVRGELSISPKYIRHLAAITEGYTGAELEQAVIAGLFEAYAEQRAVRETDFVQAIESMVPLSVTQLEAIKAIRQWADARAVPASDGSGIANGRNGSETSRASKRKLVGERRLDA
jgi:SpoVK/Ycf46/Vps4 family AAA+-type ATPase